MYILQNMYFLQNLPGTEWNPSYEDSWRVTQLQEDYADVYMPWSCLMDYEPG